MTRTDRLSMLAVLTVLAAAVVVVAGRPAPAPADVRTSARTSAAVVRTSAADTLRFARRAHVAASRSMLRRRITRARAAYLAHERRVAAERARAARERAAAARVAAARASTSTGGIPAVWIALAGCEAGGNWHADTGNGFYGGFQFTIGTWTGYGGTGDPAAAAPVTQLAVARRVLAAQGVGAWPVCGPRVGLEPGD